MCNSFPAARRLRWELDLVPAPSTGLPGVPLRRLLIGLLLCVGVRVIDYFTRVRVELVKGKGQATRLSLSCTALIHQL